MELEALDWKRVAAAGGIPLARAMFEDIADFFGEPVSPLGGTSSSLTYPASRSIRRDRLLLRNM